MITIEQHEVNDSIEEAVARGELTRAEADLAEWHGDGGDYIRHYYRVPAFIGSRIVFDGKTGTISGFADHYLLVDFGAKASPAATVHPTWRVEYPAPCTAPVDTCQGPCSQQVTA